MVTDRERDYLTAFSLPTAHARERRHPPAPGAADGQRREKIELITSC